MNGLDILADAAATRATTTQPRELPDLGHQTGACSIPTTPYTQSDTIYDDTTYNRELLSFHHKSLLSQEVFPQVCPYKSIYPNLNPPQPTSSNSQLIIEPTQEDVANCFDNDDEISLPLDFSPTRDAAADEENNLEQGA